MQQCFTSYGRPCQLWVEHVASVRTPVDLCADVCVQGALAGGEVTQDIWPGRSLSSDSGRQFCMHLVKACEVVTFVSTSVDWQL